MKFLKKIQDIFMQAITSNISAHKLALSFCIGIYIAFSPFPGMHTIIMLGTNWLLKLNFPVLFIACSINNPWTMIPFVTAEYSFGYWFVHTLLGYNPTFYISLAKVFGAGKICIWSFFIGGNILGIITALVCYPILNNIFKKLILKHSVN